MGTRVAAFVLLVALAGCGTTVGRQRLESAFGPERAAGVADDGSAATGAAAQAGAPDRRTGVVPAGADAVAAGGGPAAGPTRREAAVATASAPSGPNATATRSEIKLGHISTQSGLIGSILADVPVAVRAWVADVNARGGLGGHPVRLINADDGGDPGRARAAAQRMVEQDKVLAFFNLVEPTSEQVVAPYLESLRYPMVGGASSAEATKSPMYFTPVPGNLSINRDYLVNLVRQAAVHKVALVYCREATQCPDSARDMKAYAARLGVSIVYEGQVSLAQPDYTAEVIQARNAGAEAVVLIGDFPGGVRFIRSAHRQGWRPVFASGPAFYREEFPATGGGDAAGVVAMAETPPFSLSAKMEPYRSAVARYVPGGVLGDFGAQMWVGGRLFERIAPFLQEPATRPQILDGLYSLRGDDLGGLTPPVLTFSRGAHGELNTCVVPIKVEGGRWRIPLGDTFVCAG